MKLMSFPTTETVKVTTADMTTHEIFAMEVVVEGGVLIIYGASRKFSVAFGPGSWLEVQP